MRADADAVQPAVLRVLTVVSAVGDAAMDRGVRRAGAAAFGVIGHFDYLRRVFGVCRRQFAQKARKAYADHIKNGMRFHSNRIPHF